MYISKLVQELSILSYELLRTNSDQNSAHIVSRIIRVADSKGNSIFGLTQKNLDQHKTLWDL